MNVGVIPLLGMLAIGGPPAPVAPGLPASSGIVQASGFSGGILPVPGQGPPGAVAGLGANAPVPELLGVTIPPPAPLVAAKFLVPPAVRITAFPGSKVLSKIYSGPTVMGLRPGYVYRFELTGLPYHPKDALYPQVELRGVLVPRPGMKYMDYPIPLFFSQADIDRALQGVLITKVIYLEDPEKALPLATKPDAPIELPEYTAEDAEKHAYENGRLMAIVRLGNRKPTMQELITSDIEGTILLPGEQYLKAPILPAVYPYFSVPLYDPIRGARIPKEECFPNGGDKKEIMGIGPDGQVGGLNPTDVGGEYTVNGQRRVVPSNMTTICAPRYIIRKAELFPSGVINYLGLAQNDGLLIPGRLKERRSPKEDLEREKANEFIGTMHPSSYIGKIGTSFFIGTSKPLAIAQISGVKVEGALVEPEQLTAYPSLRPLTITKIIDPPGPKQPGDVVTVTIRYANTGQNAVSDLVISDSLSGRLEYLPGTAETDRAANFSSGENEVGSLIMRWEIPGELYPGQAGTIKFKVKVR